MKLVGVLDLRQNLAEHLSQVAQGEEIIIVQRSKPIARLRPYEEAPVSEDPAPYSALPEDLDATALADELASIALARARDDKRAARVALLQALMMLERD